MTQPHIPGESVLSRTNQEPFFVEHIDPAVIHRFDTPRSSRLCEFCREFDDQFPDRRPLDQMVAGSRLNAAAHLTEDGYVRHRMLELRQMTARAPLTAA